jgi:hypothetical protein
LQSSIFVDGNRTHLAQSTPVGDRFEPSQILSRGQGFALKSNVDTTGAAAGEQKSAGSE